MTSIADVQEAINAAADKVADKNGWTFTESRQAVYDLLITMVKKNVVPILRMKEVREGRCNCAGGRCGVRRKK